MDIKYKAKPFKTLEEAQEFKKKHGGVLYKDVPRSRTKKDHLLAAQMFGFNAEKYHFSVNWNEVID